MSSMNQPGLRRPRVTLHLVAAAIALTIAPAAYAAAPTVTTEAATNVTTNSVTVSGSVTPNGSRVTMWFDIGTSTSYDQALDASPFNVGARSRKTAETRDIVQLDCGKTYHYRLRASTYSGDVAGPDATFATLPCGGTSTPPPPPPTSTAPAATTSAASGISATAATLNATVTPGSASATVSFDWGNTTGYGKTAAATPSSVAAGSSATNVSAALSGLSCGTTYNFRATASSSVGTSQGSNQSFSTAACPVASTPPSVTTMAASGMTATAATLNSVVTAGSASATVSFDWGTTTAYGSTATASPASIAANGSANPSGALSNLACGTTYHFRAKASSSAGSANGSDMAFNTAGCTTAPPPTQGTGAYPWPTWTAANIAVPPSTVGTTYYVDGTNGNDSNTGLSATSAFRTLKKSIGLVKAGDTVLIRKGLYREAIDVSGAASGAAGKPITFGSFGDGEVIVDGSTKVGPWTQVSGTVWQATASFTPVGVVVNDVPLKQVRQGQNGSSAPQDGLAGVVSGSGKWHVNYSTRVITADFSTAIGNADPNGADIVVPNNNVAQAHVYYGDRSYYTFKGLTIRGSGAAGIWGSGSHITVESCNIKFNAKSAVSFQYGSDNAVLTSHAYQNVLLNWPRGNNGFAEAGGGWPGALSWAFNARPIARGNIVHMNGGEGILTYGTQSGMTTGSALFEQNASFDNWSVNMYFDNQPNDVARNNFIYNHPFDSSNMLYVGAYPYNNLGKYSVCLMLADEQGSSDSTNGYANLRGSQVYNNVMAGCRISIRDYSEGTQAQANHGLKDTIIANNTLVMPFSTLANTDIYGIFIQDNKTPSGTQRNVNSVIQNNVVYGFNSDPVIFSALPGAQGGVVIDYNDYYSAAAKPFGQGDSAVTYYAFAGWQAASGADAHSRFADPQFADLTQFRFVGSTPWNWASANLAAGSPARNAGTPQAFSTDFTGGARTGWNIGAF